MRAPTKPPGCEIILGKLAVVVAVTAVTAGVSRYLAGSEPLGVGLIMGRVLGVSASFGR